MKLGLAVLLLAVSQIAVGASPSQRKPQAELLSRPQRRPQAELLSRPDVKPSGWQALLNAAEHSSSAQSDARDRAGGWKDPLWLPTPSASVQRAVAPEVAAQSDEADQSLPANLRASEKSGRGKVLSALNAERNEALTQLGISPRAVGHLYILVSTSMPDGVIAGYAQAAVWTGGILVFRGVPKGKTIPWFITHVMKKWVRPPNSPTLTLNPQPFAAYGVTAVPAIIYTMRRRGIDCRNTAIKSFSMGKHKPPVQYRTCAPANPDDYWKIGGAVSVHYALEQFAAAGAPGARQLLRAADANPWFASSKAVSLSPSQYAHGDGPGSVSAMLKLIGGSGLPKWLRETLPGFQKKTRAP